MKAFFDSIRKPLGPLSQSQVNGINTILAASQGLPLRHRAYILATAWHETARTMQPIREAKAKTDEGAIAALEKAWQAGKLKWVKTPYWRKDADGKAWFGRGYVQLTHKANYAKAGVHLGIDLVADPSLALRPDIAAKILVQGSVEGWFTGKGLAAFTAYREMRRVINGTDRADDIAQLAETFEAGLLAVDDDPIFADPGFTPKPVDDNSRPHSDGKGLWASLITALLGILKGR